VQVRVASPYNGHWPIEAVPKYTTGRMSLADIDLIELNEAFAAQSLAVIRTLIWILQK